MRHVILWLDQDWRKIFICMYFSLSSFTVPRLCSESHIKGRWSCFYNVYFHSFVEVRLYKKVNHIKQINIFQLNSWWDSLSLIRCLQFVWYLTFSLCTYDFFSCALCQNRRKSIKLLWKQKETCLTCSYRKVWRINISFKNKCRQDNTARILFTLS